MPEAWPAPAELKPRFKLADGTPVSNTWLFANGVRMEVADVARLMVSKAPVHVAHRKAMLQAFAKALRNVYVRRWCGVRNKRWNAWMDTAKSNAAFLRGAAVLAQEYGRRGLTVDQFMDAAIEMCPKSLRFPTVDMIGGMFAQRFAEWLPPDQRDYDKAWDLHEDNDGHTWANIPGEGDRVLVVRNAADREHLLKLNRVN